LKEITWEKKPRRPQKKSILAKNRHERNVPVFLSELIALLYFKRRYAYDTPKITTTTTLK